MFHRRHVKQTNKTKQTYKLIISRCRFQIPTMMKTTTTLHFKRERAKLITSKGRRKSQKMRMPIITFRMSSSFTFQVLMTYSFAPCFIVPNPRGFGHNRTPQLCARNYQQPCCPRWLDNGPAIKYHVKMDTFQPQAIILLGNLI